jgi:CheY-like chemotaxis protein
MYQQTIMVVEDSTDIRVLLKMVLEVKGYRVLEAENGQQAVETALKERPELILMDLSMPVMDGWEATRQLRNYECLRDVPVIGLSAHCNGEKRELALRSGCNDCIMKPLDPPTLNKVLSEYLTVH